MASNQLDNATKDHPEYGYKHGHMNNNCIDEILDKLLRNARYFIERDVRTKRMPMYFDDAEYEARLKEKTQKILEGLSKCIAEEEIHARIAYLLPHFLPGVGPDIGFATRAPPDER